MFINYKKRCSLQETTLKMLEEEYHKLEREKTALEIQLSSLREELRYKEYIVGAMTFDAVVDDIILKLKLKDIK